MNRNVMSEVSRILVVILMATLVLLFSSCATPKNPIQPLGQESVGQGSNDMSTNDSMPSDPTEEAIGDGNLTFNIKIDSFAPEAIGQGTNIDANDVTGDIKTIRFIDAEPPEYRLAFTIGDALGRLALIPPEIRYLVEFEPGTPLTVNSTEFYNQLSHDGLVNPLKVQVVVVRAEDPFMRNPLCEPINLTFTNDKTCSEGYDFNIGIADESLTSIFEPGSLVIRVVGTEAQIDLGTYLNLIYQKPNVKIPWNYGRGISGGDFIIELTPAQMLNEGIEYGTMSIIDYENRVISDSILLHFDANGSCIEGRFIEFTLKDPAE